LVERSSAFRISLSPSKRSSPVSRPRHRSYHNAEVEAWLANQLAAREVTDTVGKARQIRLLLEGCLSLLLIHGNKAYAEMAATATNLLVEHG
jgi:hypothetical protein